MPVNYQESTLPDGSTVTYIDGQWLPTVPIDRSVYSPPAPVGPGGGSPGGQAGSTADTSGGAGPGQGLGAAAPAPGAAPPPAMSFDAPEASATGGAGAPGAPGAAPTPAAATLPAATSWDAPEAATAVPYGGGSSREFDPNYKDWLSTVSPGLDAGYREAIDAATGGFATKGQALLGAIFGGLAKGGDFSHVGDEYTANMNGLDAQLAALRAQNKVPAAIGSGIGAVAQGLVTPELEGGALAGRLIQGGLQGLGQTYFDNVGHARGNWAQEATTALNPGSLTLGMLFGAGAHGVMGAPATPSPIPNDIGAAARSGVDVTLGTHGALWQRKIAQGLAGLPYVGKPLNELAHNQLGQAAERGEELASNYGGTQTPQEAGAVINSANAANAQHAAAINAENDARTARLNAASEAAVAAEKANTAAAIRGTARSAGSVAPKMVAGENVQDAVQRYAQESGLDVPPGSPSRASSFESKANAVYNRAFAAVREGMGSKDAKAVTEEVPSTASPWVTHSVTRGGSQITAPATEAVVREIAGRSQSDAVRHLLAPPELGRVVAAIHDHENLSFNDLRNLRTWVRMARKDPELRRSIGEADLARMEGSLTSDIYKNARDLASPEAEALLRRADQFYRTGMQRINDQLAPFFKAKSGESAMERVIKAAQSQGGDERQLLALRRSIRPAEWASLASSIIEHAGASADGFSLSKFIRNYGDMSENGKQILFGGRDGQGLKRSLDELYTRAQAADSAKPTVLKPEPRELGKVHFGGRDGGELPTDEAAFEGLMSAANARGKSANPRAIDDLFAALGPEAASDVTAGVIRTMGERADTDRSFNFAKFAGQWGKWSEEGRLAIMGGKGRQADVDAMNDLARTAEHFQRNSTFYNHSGSAHQLALFEVLGMVGEGAMHIFQGRFGEGVHTLAVPVATALGGRAIAKALAKPRTAQLLQKSMNGDPRMIDAMWAKWAKDNPENADFANAIRSAISRRLITQAPTAVGARVATQQPEPVQ